MNFPTSQTPPPPQINPPSPMIAAEEPVGPGLSEPQRLINVFIAPTKTFTDIRRNASWWKPWLLATIISLAAAGLMLQKLDFPRLVQHRLEQSKLGQRQLEQADPARREQILNIQVISTKVGIFARPIFGLLIGLIIAAVLMATFNFLLGGEVPFQRAMAVVFYSSLPNVIKTLLVCCALLFSSDPGSIDPDINPVATNPGFFMDIQNGKFLYYIASGFDVIAIWSMILLGIGFATVSVNRKPSIGTGIATTLALYGLIVLGFSALGSAF